MFPGSNNSELNHFQILKRYFGKFLFDAKMLGRCRIKTQYYKSYGCLSATNFDYVKHLGRTIQHYNSDQTQEKGTGTVNGVRT